VPQDKEVDEELIELLNELRVALPGVQMLFGFLLAVPFTQRFDTVTNLQKYVYFLTFLCTAAATLFLIAPSAHHRIQWRQGEKEKLLATSNQLAIVGTSFLALALTGAVFVVTDLLFHAPVVAVVTALTAGVFGGVWFVQPLLSREQRRRS
jgi:Family of unknown function (DUF6328)